MGAPSPLPTDPVLWTEGMLLQPHHLQQAQLRSDATLQRRFAGALPDGYGLLRCRWDMSRLAAGELYTAECEALTPDGLFVDASPEAPLRLDLKDHAEALSRGPLRVTLAVPAAGPGAAIPGRDGSRWLRAAEERVVDDNTGDAPEFIGRLRVAGCLRAGPTPPAGFVGMPVAEIIIAEGAPTFSAYQPPLVAITPQSPFGALGLRINDFIDRLALAARRAAENELLTTDARLTAQALFMSHTLLRTTFTCPVLPPRRAHQALAFALAGIAAVGPTVEAPLPPDYDHSELAACFRPTLDALERKLASLAGTTQAVAFQPTATGFRLAAAPQLMEGALLIEVRPAAGQTPETCAHWIEESVIGAEASVDGLHTRRMRGAQRRRLGRDKARALGRSESTLLFEIALPDDALAAPGFTISNRGAHAALRPAELLMLSAGDTRHGAFE